MWRIFDLPSWNCIDKSASGVVASFTMEDSWRDTSDEKKNAEFLAFWESNEEWSANTQLSLNRLAQTHHQQRLFWVVISQYKVDSQNFVLFAHMNMLHPILTQIG